MRIWGITDTGLVRCENQDSYATAVVADCTVAVVCDGMGGTNGGHTASSIAVETLLQELEAALKPGMDWQQIKAVVLQAIAQANLDIRTARRRMNRCPAWERRWCAPSAVTQRRRCST